MCASFGDSIGHVIVNWHRKEHKKCDFWLESLLIPYNSKITWRAKLKFVSNLVLINGLCKPSLKASGHVTKMLPAKHGQKVDDFEPTHLGKYRFWWKMIYAFWAHSQPPFFLVCSFTPTWLLFFFFSFFLLFFLFLFQLSTFKPLNALCLKFERLEISRRTSAGMKLGVSSWGDPRQWGPPKFWTFKPLKLDTLKFWIR